jgi:hypothetical protein
MLRNALVVQIESCLKQIQELEECRAKFYKDEMEHIPEMMRPYKVNAGYENLNRSIIHYEGRVEEAREILQIIDDLEAEVVASKCSCCGHHEICIRNEEDQVPLKPGTRIVLT